MVSSNFERLLFDMYDRDGAAVSSLIERFSTGSASLDQQAWQRISDLFDSHSVDDEVTCATIADVFEKTLRWVARIAKCLSLCLPVTSAIFLLVIWPSKWVCR